MMNFRVSDHELEIINRLIRHEGLTLSEIARGLILARAKRLGLM